tara:strand:+ start:861 stop:1292 length:432 start_codon:yes stop_codon:yes gene_type:complete
MKKRLAGIRTDILSLADTMSSVNITGFSNGLKKREAFYQMLIDKLPIEVIEKLLPYFTEPKLVNLDWGDMFKALKNNSNVSIQKFNNLEEADKIDCKSLIAVIETKSSKYPDKITDLMNDITNNCVWGCGRTEKENVILLGFN